MSVENAVKVLLEAGFEYDWLTGHSPFPFSIPDKEGTEVEKHSSTCEDKIRTIVTYLLNIDPTPSWRRVIASLDQPGNEQANAKKLYEYAEPITGNSTLMVLGACIISACAIGIVVMAH